MNNLFADKTQEAKYVEGWPSTTSAWAGWSRFDIPVDRYGEVLYILCYGGPAEHWGPLPATSLASREILIEQNIKKRTGPALCGQNLHKTIQYVVYPKVTCTWKGAQEMKNRRTTATERRAVEGW
jgi:hypothetical protein